MTGSRFKVADGRMKEETEGSLTVVGG